MQPDADRLIKILTAMADHARIVELRTTLATYDHAYHVLNSPVVSDAEYDAAYRELVDLEAAHPELDDPNSPTRRIGGIGVSRFQKTRHVWPMLSLSNVFTAEEAFQKLGAGTEIHVEPKIDGLSLKLIYEDGVLVKAITRGDGTYGDDVTANARTIKTIPLKIETKADVQVVGEVYMTAGAFADLNTLMQALGEELFANPRNAAAGSFKLKDPMEVSKRGLSFVAYGMRSEPPMPDVKTQADVTATLEFFGFQSVAMLPVTGSCQSVAGVYTTTTVEDLARKIAECDTDRMFLAMETDGLVLKINSLSAQAELGVATKYPKWAWAYKFPPERKPTTLQGVTLQVGRTGKITPVAELQPVVLGGTTVKRASLCNPDEIKRLGVNVGDSVYVEKSAEIIPKVMGVAEKNTEGVYDMGNECPCCKSPLSRADGMVDYYCTNRECRDQVVARLIHATGKSALDIDGCGEVTVDLFVQHGIKTLSALMSATDLSFLKPATRAKIEASREKAKQLPLWRQLHALGIEGLGQTLCREIGARWSSLIEAFDHADDLKTLLGPAVYASVIRYFSQEADEIDRLQDAGLTFEAELVHGALTGKTFVITGEMVSGSRNTVEALIVKHGGMVKGNVSKTTSYLVKGEAAGVQKSERAQKHGIPIIDEASLYAMIGIPMPSPVPAHRPE